MKLEGIHHITAITGDAPRNVDFYVRLLGLRLVKKSVNQDDPTVYHLFYADEHGSAGSDLTFFEYPKARPGRAGAGMVHRIVHRVRAADTLDFWADRLGSEDVATSRVESGLRFADFEGLQHELRVVEVPDAPLAARSTEVPVEHALLGFHEVHASVADPRKSERHLRENLNFAEVGEHAFETRGAARGGGIVFEPAPGRGFSGAGTVHHIAWASPIDDHEAWRARLVDAGVQATPVIDRFYFRSVYSREPGGILYELATIGPGFATDEPAESLGESLALPPEFERLRTQVEPLLTPLPDVRQWRPSAAQAS
jgi:glyoxalase family protein